MESQVLAITSPAAGEGKTLTAINLAGALARESESRVLLIDADLRRPSVAATLNLPPAPGLTDVLTSDSLELSAVAQQLPPFQFWAVPSGQSGVGHPSAAALAALRSRFCSVRGRSSRSSSSTRRRCCRCSTPPCSRASSIRC